MAIREWPECIRPREKLYTRGANALSNAEVLAVIFSVGVHGKSAVALSQELLQRFGSFSAMLSAPMHELEAIKGIGKAKQAQIQGSLEMVRRILKETLGQSICLGSSAAIKNYLRLHLSHLSHEIFFCFYLSANNCLVHSEELFRGSLTETQIYPREIAKQAFRYGAAAIIIAHNHPAGSVQPSQQDCTITKHLQASLNTFDIELYDHFIVNKQQVFSIKQQMLI